MGGFGLGQPSGEGGANRWGLRTQDRAGPAKFT